MRRAPPNNGSMPRSRKGGTALPRPRVACPAERDRNTEAQGVDCVRIVHKTANVLNKVPRSMHAKVKPDLREIWTAPDKATAEAAIDIFAETYAPKYDRAVQCLLTDRERVLTFFDFPAEHWDHLRSSNPIESVFGTVRHRTVRTKGALSQNTAKLMVFKLVMAAAKTWRRLKGENQLPKVIEGVTFKDGIEVTEAEAHAVA